MRERPRPVIGITIDIEEGKFVSSRRYADAVYRAGGEALLLVPPPSAEMVDATAAAHAALVDGVVFTGGRDVRMEAFGEATHAAAKVMHELRQAYDFALYRAMDAERNRRKPVLGICLGMQEMALHRGGRLTQHMPDVMGEDAAKAHAADALHAVRTAPTATTLRGVDAASAKVASWHHQSVREPGALTIAATSEDGVIEAIEDPNRPFYLGVQWHPERSPCAPGADDLSDGLFRRLVDAAKRTGE